VAFRSVPAQKVPLSPRFATRAYRGSRNLRAVQTLLGHESIMTTDVYGAWGRRDSRGSGVRVVMLADKKETTRIVTYYETSDIDQPRWPQRVLIPQSTVAAYGFTSCWR